MASLPRVLRGLEKKACGHHGHLNRIILPMCYAKKSRDPSTPVRLEIQFDSLQQCGLHLLSKQANQ